MSCFLGIYDLSGIQKFIFATNEMPEIIGASEIVHNLLFSGLPQAIGLDKSNWNAWKEGPVSFSDADTAKIVYVGGGNALVLFQSESAYADVTEKVREQVFLQSGGTIRVYSACIALDETASLNDNQKKLMAKLDAAKKCGGNTIPMPALPITAVDNNSYEPLVMVEQDKYTTVSRYAKLKAFNAMDAFSDLCPAGLRFKTNFLDDRQDDSKNYQAVIHLDGNTMGIKIREFVQSISKPEAHKTIWEQLTAMRDLSVAIGALFHHTLKHVIGELYAGQTGKISFRPIIADGDDITVMISAAAAFDFVSLFIQTLEQQKIDKFGESFRPTAAAGIAFVNLKYPFSTAYELAEACCKNAKAQTILRCGGAEKFLARPVSSVDYQTCASNIPGDLTDFRRDNYVFGDYSIIRRPYIFDDTSAYAYSSFAAMSKAFAANVSAGTIARSKLKGLRNAYAGGAEEALAYCRYISAHATTPEERAISAFNEKRESDVFDYLDVMDVTFVNETEGDA